MRSSFRLDIVLDTPSYAEFSENGGHQTATSIHDISMSHTQKILQLGTVDLEGLMINDSVHFESMNSSFFKG